MKKIVIYFIAFDPILSFTCWTLQNDCHNLSFVKATNVVGKKMARNGHKMAIYESKNFSRLGQSKRLSEPQFCESY